MDHSVIIKDNILRKSGEPRFDPTLAHDTPGKERRSKSTAIVRVAVLRQFAIEGGVPGHGLAETLKCRHPKKG